MVNRSVRIYGLLIIAVVAVVLLLGYSGRYQDAVRGAAAAYPADAQKVIAQVVKPIDLDRPFDFAGEPLPMDNFDVRQRLDRELVVNTYYHSNTILSIKNAGKYFPVIEPILAKNGIPDDFKYLAVAESSLRNAVSPAGAKGIWQFMPAMASAYDMEVNREVDERYHLEKATRAFCSYIKEHYERFGSWTLAAVSYNLGGTRLARSLREQRAKNFYELNLNQETSRYLFRLVALKEILSHPSDFGFYIEEEHTYRPLTDYRIVKVDTSISNLGDFAVEHGANYRMLKVYNPWLLHSRLTNRRGKVYEIKIPK